MKNFSMNISNMALYAVNKKYAIKKKKNYEKSAVERPWGGDYGVSP